LKACGARTQDYRRATSRPAAQPTAQHSKLGDTATRCFTFTWMPRSNAIGTTHEGRLVERRRFARIVATAEVGPDVIRDWRTDLSGDHNIACSRCATTLLQSQGRRRFGTTYSWFVRLPTLPERAARSGATSRDTSDPRSSRKPRHLINKAVPNPWYTGSLSPRKALQYLINIRPAGRTPDHLKPASCHSTCQIIQNRSPLGLASRFSSPDSTSTPRQHTGQATTRFWSASPSLRAA
jgi:hypothetical protein